MEFRSRYYTQENSLSIVNTMSNYQLGFIAIDIICNLVLDSTTSDPMVGFILFLIQVLTLLINLISVVMMSSHKAIQTITNKSMIHTFNTFTMLSYLSLTIVWYVWSLRRTWPAAGDQFSYTFLPKSNSSNSSDILPFGSGFDHLKDNREFYTLWSPGFIALYTCQRTAALLYYGIHLKSIFQLVNTGRMLTEITAKSSNSVLNVREKQLKMQTVSAIVDRRSLRTQVEKSAQLRAEFKDEYAATAIQQTIPRSSIEEASTNSKVLSPSSQFRQHRRFSARNQSPPTTSNVAARKTSIEEDRDRFRN